MNSYKELLKKHYAEKGQHFTHCSKPTEESFGGRYCFGREGLEQLFDQHSNLVMNDREFLSATLEIPQHYSMLRVDMDYKVKGATTVKPLYKVFDALNFIKNIQGYLKEHIDGIKPDHLRCAFLAKDPYIKDGDLRHGYHLQFVHCFLSKEANTRLAEHFHALDSNFDKIHNHPWLIYGSQKSKESGRYTVEQIVMEDGSCQDPEEYFQHNYSIFDLKERKIKFDKPIAWYYPRIFSILPFNRPTCEFKPEVNNFLAVHRNTDYFDRQESYGDCEEFGDQIREIVQDYIRDEMDGALTISQPTDSGFKLKNTGTFTCPIDSSETHSRLGAFVNIFDGGVYIGCYKCKSQQSKATRLIGSFRESSRKIKVGSKTELDFSKLVEVLQEIFQFV